MLKFEWIKFRERKSSRYNFNVMTFKSRFIWNIAVKTCLVKLLKTLEKIAKVNYRREEGEVFYSSIASIDFVFA